MGNSGRIRRQCLEWWLNKETVWEWWWNKETVWGMVVE